MFCLGRSKGFPCFRAWARCGSTAHLLQHTPQLVAAASGGDWYSRGNSAAQPCSRMLLSTQPVVWARLDQLYLFLTCLHVQRAAYACSSACEERLYTPLSVCAAALGASIEACMSNFSCCNSHPACENNLQEVAAYDEKFYTPLLTASLQNCQHHTTTKVFTQKSGCITRTHASSYTLCACFLVQNLAGGGRIRGKVLHAAVSRASRLPGRRHRAARHAGAAHSGVAAAQAQEREPAMEEARQHPAVSCYRSCPVVT